jgi:glutamate-1-semialdehyde 2,1-aminomutase/spore coat polysaccharide biosynthesis protein SpsF
MYPLKRSQELYAAALRRVPHCSSSFSKGQTQFVHGVAPIFAERAEGCTLYDVDGNPWIDFTMALCPCVLGYGHPVINEAVARQLADGTTFTLPHRLEVELAEKLAGVIPCAEMTRLGKNGSDVTTAAVRVARAFTGRDMVACCGYHGWHDWYVGTTPRDIGVPAAVAALTRTFAYNDIDSLRSIFTAHPGRVACVIMEPTHLYPPENDFLGKVKTLCREQGAVLVFDEIVTGFRWALGGAQELYNVTPDLATFGKAMANGLPLSVLVGRSEVMEYMDKIFYSFTFAGEALSLAAAMACIDYLREHKVIDFLWTQGEKMQKGYDAAAETAGLAEVTRCAGVGPRHVMLFNAATEEESLLMKSYVQQESLKRGYLFYGCHNMSLAHDDAVCARVLDIYAEVLPLLREALDAGDLAGRIEGRPISPVFKRV